MSLSKINSYIFINQSLNPHPQGAIVINKTIKNKNSMTSKQNSLDIALDKMQKGELTAAQANVLMVQMEGVRVIKGKLMMDVRKALNEAVKTGELGHIKKEGLRPEVYHHKNARPKALSIRDEIFRNSIKSMSNIYSKE